MAELDPFSDCCRSISDHRHLGQQTTTFDTLDPATTPAADRGAGDRNGRVIDCLVNRLRAQLPVRLLWETDLQFMTDLLRAPSATQQLQDHSMERCVSCDPALPGPYLPRCCQSIRGCRQVAAVLVDVAIQLATDRRHRPAKIAGDCSHTQTGALEISDRGDLVIGDPDLRLLRQGRLAELL